MAAPPFKPVQLDCGMARLFSQLVSLRLAEIMTHSDEDMTWSGFDHFPSTFESLEHRLVCVENSQKQIMTMLQQIMLRLDAGVTSGSSVLPVTVPDPAIATFPSITSFSGGLTHSATRAVVLPSKDACISSSPGSSASPDGFLFVCPLCLRPQHTPKTHCEHMRRMSVGEGQCSLQLEPSLMPDRHRRILHVFGNAPDFVKWCVQHVTVNMVLNNTSGRYCCQLRSGAGREYLPEDVAAYNNLQQQLDSLLTAGVPLYLAK
jgi:hypothetical protein